ncbi:MAG: ParB/RepB/Spo0J family partition protein [Clostridia bacterium]|nr:ParB/RepB/Spo0J family partition protein [Clostridia bacterium]
MPTIAEKQATFHTASEQECRISLHPSQIYAPEALKQASISQNAIIRLATSIRKYGLLEPICVRKRTEGQGAEPYELVGGERQLAAAILAGCTQIPCILQPESAKSRELDRIFSILRQKSLHFLEEGSTFYHLIQEYHMTQDQIAQKLGISQSSVANKLRLLQFNQQERRQIMTNGLTERHARALLRLKTPELRALAMERIAKNRLKVAETEDLVAILLQAPPVEPQKGPSEPTQRSVTVAMAEQPLKGVLPRKFAIQSLEPLYNSIEKTLSIFRKTGAEVSCTRTEGDFGVRITIEVPYNT